MIKLPAVPPPVRDRLAEALVGAAAAVWTLGFFAAVHLALLKLTY
jgi:hypothetical protein